jgi:anti-anti-sigma factor
MDEGPELKTVITDGVTVASFKGEATLDSVTTQRIGREFYAIVESGDTDKVVLDFANLQFLSSQALGVLLTLRRKAEKAGVKVAIACIRPELVRVFEITNLSTMFGFYDSVDEAAAGLRQAQ